MPEARITITDVRRANHCVMGTRAWFGQRGLDFAKFLKEGISETEFLATGDALAEDIVNRKRQRDGQ